MSSKIIVSAIVFLVIGGAGGYFFGYDIGWERALMQHSHDDAMKEDSHMMEDDAHSHGHDQVEAPKPVPFVDLTVHKDPKSGWNAKIILSNFRFAPERVSTENIDGEGHAHIYVDGKKINRVYSEWYHLGELSSGMHEISVRLSTNDHKELLNGGQLISDSETIHVTESADAMLMDSHQ